MDTFVSISQTCRPCLVESRHSGTQSAGAANGRGPTADPWTSPRWKRQWPEQEANEFKDETAKAQEFFNASIQNLGTTEPHEADC